MRLVPWGSGMNFLLSRKRRPRTCGSGSCFLPGQGGRKEQQLPPASIFWPHQQKVKQEAGIGCLEPSLPLPPHHQSQAEQPLCSNKRSRSNVLMTRIATGLCHREGTAGRRSADGGGLSSRTGRQHKHSSYAPVCFYAHLSFFPWGGTGNVVE